MTYEVSGSGLSQPLCSFLFNTWSEEQRMIKRDRTKTNYKKSYSDFHITVVVYKNNMIYRYYHSIDFAFHFVFSPIFVK